MSSPVQHQEGNKPGKSQWPWARCHCQLLEWSNSCHHHLHHHCPLGVCWHLLPHWLHLHLLQAQEGLSFTRNKQQEKQTAACSPSPHSKAMLASFKQFYLLAILSSPIPPSSFGLETLLDGVLSCSAASFYPLSSRALESIVWSWRRLCLFWVSGH